MVSCTSIINNTPSWVLKPPKVLGSLVFIGTGRGGSENAARDASLSDALSKMGDGLGYDIVGKYLRELSWTGRISDFRGNIANTYYYVSGGIYTCYSMVVVNSSDYNAAKSEYTIEREKNGERIKALLESAFNHYKDNEDTEAVSDSLRALEISLNEGTSNDAPSSEEILSVALGYLSSVKLSFVGNSPTDKTTLKAVRDKGFFKPVIVNALIDVEYTAYSGTDERKVTMIARTDSKGRAEYSATDPFMLRSGKLRFSLHLPEEIIEMIHSSSNGFFDEFMSVYDSISVEKEYKMESPFPDGEPIIVLSTFDMNDEERDYEGDRRLLEDHLRVVGIEGFSVTDVIPDDARYVIRISINIYDRNSMAGRIFMKADGEIRFSDSENGEEKSFSVSAVGSGENYDEAEDSAISECVMRAAEGIYHLFMR